MRLRVRLLPGLVALLLVLQLLFPYRAWAAMLVGLGGVWAIAYLWARSLANGLHLTRETRFEWAHVGDKMLERFTLANESIAPAVWLRLTDHSTLPGLRRDLGTHIGGYSTSRWNKESVCTRRGLFTLGPTSLQAGDPFGIYLVEIPDAASASLLVMPPVLDLPAIQVAAGGSLGDGRPSVDALERTVSSARVTEYQPGHSLRWIHWPTSAKKDAPFVRLFDATPSGDWWIVLDLQEEVQAGEDLDSTLEHAIVLAASLSVRELQSRRPVGLIAQTGLMDWIWLPPRREQVQRWEILHALTLALPGRTSLAEILERVSGSFARPASLIVVTPATLGDWVPALLQLSRQGAVPTVLLLDPLSYSNGVSRSVAGNRERSSAAELLPRAGVTHFVLDSDFLDLPASQPAERWDRTTLQEVPWRALS